MEWINKMMQWVKKYRFVAFILLAGVALMLIPFGGSNNEEPKTQPTEPIQTDITQELCSILRQIDGAGEVSVMLSVRSGIRTVYQTDQNETSGENGSNREDTVIITDENRSQAGLIQQIIYPEYRGAIIVCEGADNIQVKASIMEAVSRITGLGMDKISVIKMK